MDPAGTISIRRDGGVPPHEQLADGLRAAIADGRLAPGARLPTVRALAGELSLAPGTVARAYRELERSGLVTTSGRNGTFVALSADARRRGVEEAARRLADGARASGLDRPTVEAIVAAVLDEAYGR